MKQTVLILFIACIATGCATFRNQNFVELLHEKRIPEINFDKHTVQEALSVLSEEWRKQADHPMPVAEVTRIFEYSDPDYHKVTFRAHDLSFMESIRLIANISGYRIELKENLIVLTNIWPGERMSFQLRLDAKLKKRLGLKDNPSSSKLREALETRGVDFTSGDMRITILDDIAFISGFTGNAELARSVLTLVKTGYEVEKREPQQENLGD